VSNFTRSCTFQFVSEDKIVLSIFYISIFFLDRESKALWNIYTEAYFLSMIATTLSIQDLSVQKHNHVSLLGGQLAATMGMYVLLLIYTQELVNP